MIILIYRYNMITTTNNSNNNNNSNDYNDTIHDTKNNTITD
jgi:hypothetical protein